MMLSTVIRSIYCSKEGFAHCAIPLVFHLYFSFLRFLSNHCCFKLVFLSIICLKSISSFESHVLSESSGRKCDLAVALRCVDIMNFCWARCMALYCVNMVDCSSHTWLNHIPITQWMWWEYGHWNHTLPFALLSCWFPLWFNRQLNFLLVEICTLCDLSV